MESQTVGEGRHLCFDKVSRWATLNESQTEIKIAQRRTSLVVQWFRLQAPAAGGVGLIPGQGTKIQHAIWPKKKKKDFQEKY